MGKKRSKKKKNSISINYKPLKFMLFTFLSFVLVSALFMAIMFFLKKGTNKPQADNYSATAPMGESTGDPAADTGSEQIVKIQKNGNGEYEAEDVTKAVAIASLSREDSDKRKYKASSQIKLAKKDSGSVQLANLFFTLPIKMSVFLDNGIEVKKIDGKTPSEKTDFLLTNTSTHDVLLYYNGIYFMAMVYNLPNHDNGSSIIKDFYVLSLTEDYATPPMNENIDHIFVSGGVSIGDFTDDVISLWDGKDHFVDAALKTGDVIHNFGYRGTYTIDKTNMLSVRSHAKEDRIFYVNISRNILE